MITHLNVSRVLSYWKYCYNAFVKKNVCDDTKLSSLIVANINRWCGANLLHRERLQLPQASQRSMLTFIIISSALTIFETCEITIYLNINEAWSCPLHLVIFKTKAINSPRHLVHNTLPAQTIPHSSLHS